MKPMKCIILVSYLLASVDLFSGPLASEISRIERQFSRWERRFTSSFSTPDAIEEAHAYLNILLKKLNTLLSQCSDTIDEEYIKKLTTIINERIISFLNSSPISKSEILLKQTNEIYRDSEICCQTAFDLIKRAKTVYYNPEIICHNRIKIINYQKEELEKILTSLNQSLEDSSQKEEHSQILEAISIVNGFIQNLNPKTTLEDIKAKIKQCNFASLKRGQPNLEKIKTVQSQMQQILQELLSLKGEKFNQNLEDLEFSLRSDIDFTQALSEHVQNPTQESANKLKSYESSHRWYVINVLEKTGFREPHTRGNR